MSTVTLKITNGDTVTKEKHSIEGITGWQFIQVMKVVKGIIKELSKDDSLQSLLDDTFGGEFALDPDAPEEMVKQMDGQFLVKLAGSFDFLLETVPEKAFELLSVVSNIGIGTLKQQDVFDLFDIYDAVLETNDIEKLINRAKKSLGATVAKLKFMKKVKEVTQM